MIYFAVMFFLFGIVMGSFYHVVGSRLANGESIVTPRSHCTSCGNTLNAFELIPIVSFLIQGGKCKHCKKKISWMYPIFELCTGLLFSFSYLQFGCSIHLLIALTFLSTLLIVFVSDYESMIILDEILLLGFVLLFIEFWIRDGLVDTFHYVFNGCIAFGIMYLLKVLGDFLFGKESMGGGDIKLLFLFGFVLGYEMAVISIFLGALIGLPIALMIAYKKNTNIIAFGPFLITGALSIFYTGITWSQIFSYLKG